MKFPRRIATADEQDAYTGWRRYYCYLGRAGVVKSVKRATHKRERREGRDFVRKEAQSDVDG